MKIRNRIAPLALSAALAFGVAACDDTADGVAEDTEEMEQDAEDMEEDAEAEMEEGTDEMEEEMDEEAGDEG